MGKQVSWHVELALRPGKLDDFRALTAEMVQFARGEVGVLCYERFRSDDGTLVHVYERFADSAAAVAHLLAFKTKFAKRFEQMVERKRFLVYGVPNDELKQLLSGLGPTYLAPLDGFSSGERH